MIDIDIERRREDVKGKMTDFFVFDLAPEFDSSPWPRDARDVGFGIWPSRPVGNWNTDATWTGGTRKTGRIE